MVTRRQPARTATKRKRAVPEAEVPTPRAFWDRLRAIGDAIPEEEWRKIPRDAAEHFDEYLEGARDEP